MPVVAHLLHRLDRAGAEVLAVELARHLRERDARIQPVLLTLDGLGSLANVAREHRIPVACLGRRPGLDHRLVRRLGTALADHGVDLVHAHQYTPFCYAAMARFASRTVGPRFTDLPLLFTEHGRHHPDRVSLKRRMANRLLLAPQDRVTAVAPFVRRALIERERIPGHRIRVIPNGIPPMGVEERHEGGCSPTYASASSSSVPSCLRASVPSSKADLRRVLSLPLDTAVVFHIARFHPVKDHDTGLEAFALLHNRLPNVRLALIGDGTGEQKRAVRSRIESLGLNDVVHVLGHRPDARELLPAADALMLPSLSEGASVTLLEALAAGVPIAATDVGGTPEVVTHHQTALLSPRQDPAALATHLHALLTQPALARRLADQGKADFAQRFTQDLMLDAYLSCYHEMLGLKERVRVHRFPQAAELNRAA